jgi:Flp pilus assembly pilin Flp
MLKAFLKRVKSQKGMSGVLVALLLVIVGVGLVAGISTFMNTQSDSIQSAAQTEITNAINSASGSTNQ